MILKERFLSLVHGPQLLQIAMLVVLVTPAFAQSNRFAADPSYPDYFVISSQQVTGPSSAETSLLPEQAVESLAKTFAVTMGNFNLMKWDRAGRPLPNPKDPYDRDKHFGTWIDDKRDNNCLDTRGKILLRTSRVPVTYTNAQKCVIATGEWLDPYTNRIFRKASDIQIDHFIPLKQAYTTGAWTWNQKARCLYANYLFNEIQLLAVDASQNQIKKDHAPDQYMPPNKQIWCGYLSNWLKVKLIWNLVMTPQEAQGIANIFTAMKCNQRDFQVPEAELQKQRATISANATYCDYDSGQQPQ